MNVIAEILEKDKLVYLTEEKSAKLEQEKIDLIKSIEELKEAHKTEIEGLQKTCNEETSKIKESYDSKI